jgi:hypothetical protein
MKINNKICNHNAGRFYRQDSTVCIDFIQTKCNLWSCENALLHDEQKKTMKGKESTSHQQTQSIYTPSHASPSKVSPIQNAMCGRRTMAEAKRRAGKKEYRNVVRMYHGHRA